MESTLQWVHHAVTDDMSSILIGNFSKQEVDFTLKQVVPLKALVPDGVLSIFFQHYGKVIGENVSQVVLSCLNTSMILPDLNYTFLTSIPKTKSPELVTEFRPIVLCNIICRLISKVLANRLKKFFFHIISESQSSFQADKAISDNILMAIETLHHMKTMNFGKFEFGTLKGY